MAQHIGITRQDEQGNVIEDSRLNFAPASDALWKLKDCERNYPWLATVDPYGDTVLNHLQTPKIIQELRRLMHERIEKETNKLLEDVVVFLNKVKIHQYIKFIGD